MPRRAVEFSPHALAHIDDLPGVAKVLSAHVRATRGGGLRRDVIVRGRRLQFRVDAELITVLEAHPVAHSDS